MRTLRVRSLVFAALTVAAVSLLSVGAAVEPLRGLSVDILFWLRHHAIGPRWTAAESPSAVIAFDEETYRTPPFADLPHALWTPQIAAVINALLAADAKVIGLDVIFSTSIERFAPGYERAFLRALRAAGRDGRIVLAKVQHQMLPIRPYPAQSFAVGHSANIRAVNLFRDPDEVIRRAPLIFEAEDSAEGALRHEPAFALEIARRVAGVALDRKPDGTVRFGDYAVPGSRRNAMLLDFQGGGADIPTFSLADIAACAEAGDTAFFRRHFAGKAVLFGAVLDVEDRKLTSRRFVTGVEGAGYGPRCALAPRPGLVREDVVRGSIPGVYIHATAINNLLRRDALRAPGLALEAAITVALLALAALAALTLRAWAAATAFVLGSLAWTAAATAAFAEGLALPFLVPVIGVAAVIALLSGYRFGVAEREQRFLRRSFGLYLAPQLVERLVRAERPPELGGEVRDVTVLFSDVVGFSRIAEGLSPQALVGLMNTYLAAMTDEIEAHGGFVDKYIGDAIVAVFGAPIENPGHARSAVEAALACADRLRRMNEDAGSLFGSHTMRMRIGLNSGEVLVGNIGSGRRFNYTVMGDTVNLASRLEGANTQLGTTVLCAAGTVARVDGAIGFREIDTIRVVGRAEPERVFTPIGAALDGDPAGAYARGLAAYRDGRFADAVAALTPIAAQDPPAASLAARAAALAAAPPADWRGVTDLTEK
jgi:class 3 adenylate cyclase